ncbi:MAG: patatin-like phospholipase family protein, partial [Actinomycetota bacterium]|nr:patatin-like phospholipase family protein [Actinomycetota bacterium]
MRSHFRWLAALLILAHWPTGPLAGQASCPAGPTALVLSGGGAKGFVHLGVLRELDSLGIRPDMVVGTSMGAVVGAMYASGYSGQEIEALARSLPLSELVRPRNRPLARAYPALRPLIFWELDAGRVRLAPSVVPDHRVAAALNGAMLRGNLRAGGDFTRLPIPFYAVATDLALQQSVVLDSGDLAQAVRASMAIPLVFEPVPFGDRTLGDGGLTANVPIRIARRLGARRLIISDLYRQRDTAPDFGSPLTVTAALIDYLFNQSSDTASATDVVITSDVTGVGNLDFSGSALDTLVRRGHAAARVTLADGAPCLPRGTIAPVSPAAPPRVTRLAIPGFADRDLELLLATLGLVEGGEFDPVTIRRGLAELAEDERYRALWLNPTPTDSGIALNIEVRRMPQGSLGTGIAYDNELGARMWGGVVFRDPVTRLFEVTGLATVGGYRRDIHAAARRRIITLGRPIFLSAITAGHEEIPFFSPEGDPTLRRSVGSASGMLGFEWTLGEELLIRLAGEARAWADTGEAGHEALIADFQIQRVSPDGDQVSAVEVQLSPRFQRASLDWRLPLMAGSLDITPRVRGGVVTGEEIPPGAEFTLGGFDGFPGLHLLERRATSEAMLAMEFSYRVSGP